MTKNSKLNEIRSLVLGLKKSVTELEKEMGGLDEIVSKENNKTAYYLEPLKEEMAIIKENFGRFEKKFVSTWNHL